MSQVPIRHGEHGMSHISMESCHIAHMNVRTQKESCLTVSHCVSLCLTVSASHCVGMRLLAHGVAHHSAVVHYSVHHKESRNKRQLI